MTFTAIRPVRGRWNGRERVEYSDAHASSSISVLSAFFSLVYGSTLPPLNQRRRCGDPGGPPSYPPAAAAASLESRPVWQHPARRPP